MISLDGTPPVAKLEQQRQRRYKAWYTSNTLNEATKDSPFKTIQITTGTPFMKKLNNALTRHFSKPKLFNVNNLIVSTSDVPGEGESKIF